MVTYRLIRCVSYGYLQVNLECYLWLLIGESGALFIVIYRLIWCVIYGYLWAKLVCYFSADVVRYLQLLEG